MEHDLGEPPRMLIKIDIEKAYDALEWYAILATIAGMNFPLVWISWVKACNTSPSFFFLINGQPTSWSISKETLYPLTSLSLLLKM